MYEQIQHYVTTSMDVPLNTTNDIFIVPQYQSEPVKILSVCIVFVSRLWVKVLGN